MMKRDYHELNKEDRCLLVKHLAIELGTSEEAVEEKLAKPWSLRGLADGSFRDWEVPKDVHPKRKFQKLILVLRIRFASSRLRHILELKQAAC